MNTKTLNALLDGLRDVEDFHNLSLITFSTKLNRLFSFIFFITPKSCSFIIRSILSGYFNYNCTSSIRTVAFLFQGGYSVSVLFCLCLLIFICGICVVLFYS